LTSTLVKYLTTLKDIKKAALRDKRQLVSHIINSDFDAKVDENDLYSS